MNDNGQLKINRTVFNAVIGAAGHAEQDRLTRHDGEIATLQRGGRGSDGVGITTRGAVHALTHSHSNPMCELHACVLHRSRHEPLTVLATLVGAEKMQIPSQAMEVKAREVTPQL
jgi:hypothetical protein